MFVKTMDVRNTEAISLLDRLIRDKAIDVHGEKLNCAEDRHPFDVCCFVYFRSAASIQVDCRFPFEL
ncbi:hypothetical protein ACHAXA_000897 [Cyclostephanos tholiformis]|uniref:Uncharacterized protein n=1 Tax=Cyclostephanos tholiformis TaxID=382380 RepID=A0ABD3R2H4_9STRA